MAALRLGARLARLPVCNQFRRTLADQAPAELRLTFASPGSSLYKHVTVKQVDVPTSIGMTGILYDHVPTLGVLMPGVVTVCEVDGATKQYFVSSGGFTMNRDSSLQILAEEAVPVEHLDAQAVSANLEKARQEASAARSDEEIHRAAINVEVHQAMANAIK